MNVRSGSIAAVQLALAGADAAATGEADYWTAARALRPEAVSARKSNEPEQLLCFA